jgi:hemerythrin-like domain-containing protein
LRSAIRLLKAEHKALVAVLHALLYHGREIEQGAPANFELLTAALRYIREFPERLHHPKEERRLFPLLLRHADARAVIERLGEEHRLSPVRLDRIEAALARFRTEGVPAYGELADRLREFARFQWDHIRVEESELLPLAGSYLTDEDWKAIDAEFEADVDPLGSGGTVEGEFAQLREHLVRHAPPTLGLVNNIVPGRRRPGS